MLKIKKQIKMIGNAVMIFSDNLFMVCLSLAFHAASYNFASGSGDALAYIRSCRICFRRSREQR